MQTESMAFPSGGPLAPKRSPRTSPTHSQPVTGRCRVCSLIVRRFGAAPPAGAKPPCDPSAESACPDSNPPGGMEDEGCGILSRLPAAADPSPADAFPAHAETAGAASPPLNSRF